MECRLSVIMLPVAAAVQAASVADPLPGDMLYAESGSDLLESWVSGPALSLVVGPAIRTMLVECAQPLVQLRSLSAQRSVT